MRRRPSIASAHGVDPESGGAGELSNAFALNVLLRQTATLIGPFLAGVLIAALGLSGSLFVNAASYLGVIVCLVAMHVRATARPAK